jgi:hypothetical protein
MSSMPDTLGRIEETRDSLTAIVGFNAADLRFGFGDPVEGASDFTLLGTAFLIFESLGGVTCTVLALRWAADSFFAG